MAKGEKRKKTAGKKTAVSATPHEEAAVIASEGEAKEIVKEDLTVKPEPATVLPESQAEPQVDNPAEDAKKAEPKKKRGGRKPMTAQEKAEAAKKREEEKAKADTLAPLLVLQYQGTEVDTAALIEAAKREFKSQHKRTLITSLQMYLKPEENTAYYVINGSITGAVKY